MSDIFSTKAKLLISILTMLCLILIAYANTLFSPFNFDDQALLQRVAFYNPHVYHQVWPVQYRHLFYLSFSLNHSLSGLDTFSYHLTNILFHFSSSVVVLFIVFKTLNKDNNLGGNTALGLSLTTGILFGLNPLNTEAVTYLSGRASGIGGFFYLLALLFFIMGSERNRKLNIPIFYSLTLLAFGLALISKETTLTFPLAVILYELCFMRNKCWHPFKVRLFFIYLPIFFLTGTLLILSPGLRNIAIDWLGKIDTNYALAQAKVLIYALKICLLPINLTFDYDFPAHWLISPSLFPVSIWLIVLLVFIKNFRWISPVAAFSLLWFFITLSPTNSFLPRADLLSERNLYLPSVGLSFLSTYVFYGLFYVKAKGSLSKTGTALLVTFILMLGSLLITRNSAYRSNIHLWEDTYKKSPTDLKVLHNLSHFYLEEKRYQKAFLPLLKLSRSAADDFYRAFAHSNLGSIYAQNGKLDQAKKEFQKAIELEPSLPIGYMNLGTYHASRGEFDRAQTQFLLARDRYIMFKWGYPMPPDLDFNLARVTLQLKSFSEAEKYINKYLQKVPSSSKGLLLLGKIYQESGKIELSEETYKKIQGGGINSAKAYNNLGILFIKQKKYEKARNAFNASINFYPKISDAHYNLGKLILDSKGDTNLARRHLEFALAYNRSPYLKQEIDRLLEEMLSP